jgi:peptidoglycan/LPS O-acetylase OafA/YrhL
LKIEIGFYLIVPLILATVRRAGWWVLALIFGASVAYSVLMLHLGDVRLARQLPGQLQFFVVGVAWYLYGGNLRIPRFASLAVAVAFCIAWSTVHPIPPGIRPFAVAAFAFSLALYAPIVRMHLDISYSVYLLHGPLLQTLLLLGLFEDNLVFLGGIVCVVLALSFMTERFVERPGIALGRRVARWLERRAAIVPSIA